MNHIRQSGETCYPTTVAMLSGQPVSQVIQTLLRHTPFRSWDEMMDTSVRLTLGEINLITDIVHNNARSILPWISPESLRVSYNQPRVSLSPSVLNGRGTISVRRPGAGHVVAFENGTIYDPGFAQPIPWELWEMMHDMSGSKIVNLTVDPESVRHEETKEAEETEGQVGRYTHSENW
jgi:hypothetical protein